MLNVPLPTLPDAAHRSRRPRIAVIGGGISGLSAAHRLQKLLPHAELQLFEASDRLGGPLYTMRSGNALLEQGADNFLLKTPWALDLCRELGLADRIMPTNERHRRALVVRDGKLYPVPEGFVLMRPQNVGAMLRSPLLSLAGKGRLLLEPLVRRPSEAERPGYDESAASFATRRLGRETYERLVQPLIAGVFVADARRLSLAATFPEFLEAEREHGSLWRSVRAMKTKAAAKDNAAPYAAARYGQFVTLRGGMSELIEALASQLPVQSLRLHTPVTQVTRQTPSRWTINTTPGAPLEHFDGLVLATHAPQSATLLRQVDAELASELARIEYASSAVVTLAYRRADIDHPLDGFGLVVPAVERRPIVAASFLTVKFPSHGPPDRATIRAFMGGALQAEMVDRDDDELTAIARRELAELIGAHGEPLEIRVMRWRESMPQYHVGHMTLVDSIERLASRHAGLELAGNAYRGVGVPQSVRSGQLAAERLAASLVASQPHGEGSAGPS